VELAASRLRAKRIDLLQFHTWTYDDPAWLDALFALMELRRQGLVGQVGLTNTDTVHLRMALDSGIALVSNQVSFSLLDRRALDGLLPLCLERGVHLLAYGVLAGGLLTDRWFGQAEPTWDDDATPWSLNKYRRFIEQVGGWQVYQGVLAAARAIADRHAASIASVAIRSILDEPGVAGVIIGARLGESEHVQDTLRAFELQLTDEDRQELAAATEVLKPLPGDCGDEYRRPPFLTASGDLSHHLESLPAPYPTRARAGRTYVATGTGWEAIAGYSRAVRANGQIQVSGTTANHGDRLIGGTSAESQTHFVIDKIEGSLRSLGARLADVVRTRIYVADEADVEAVARAHGHRLGEIRPANTLVIAGLVGDDLKVEIEAEALIGD
jgi:diketogulonate reductase-like aldo/keto reductase/enamine deaminase RidA (YjgF/YER057c/UK114 family)